MPLQRGEVRGYDFNRMVVEFTMLNRDKIRRLASALGEWPWTDVFMSSETSNLLLSTLSASMVGVGDALG